RNFQVGPGGNRFVRNSMGPQDGGHFPTNPHRGPHSQGGAWTPYQRPNFYAPAPQQRVDEYSTRGADYAYDNGYSRGGGGRGGYDRGGYNRGRGNTDGGRGGYSRGGY